MEPPSLFWNKKSDEPLTGIFIPMSGDEALNLHIALQNRASGSLPSERTITEVAHSYTSFELALLDLDAKVSFVLRGTSANEGNAGTIGATSIRADQPT